MSLYEITTDWCLRGIAVTLMICACACDGNPPPPSPTVAPDELAQIESILQDAERRHGVAEAAWNEAMAWAASRTHDDGGKKCPVEVWMFSHVDETLKILGTMSLAKAKSSSDGRMRPAYGTQFVFVHAATVWPIASPHRVQWSTELFSLRDRRGAYTQLSGTSLIAKARELAETESWTWDLVVVLDQEVKPRLTAASEFVPGALAGRTYIYSHKDRRIVCAGVFAVTNEEEVLLWKERGKTTTEEDVEHRLMDELWSKFFSAVTGSLYSVGD